MANCKGLLERDLRNPKGLRFVEICSLAKCFGFEFARQRGGMNRFSCSVAWSEEDEGYLAKSLEIAGVTAWGTTASEAVRELSVAVEAAIESYKEEGWDIPSPRTVQSYSGQFRLRLPKSLHAWMAREAHLEGVSLNTFAVARLSEARGGYRPDNALGYEPLTAQTSQRL